MFGLLFRYVFREILTSSLLGTVLATFVVFLQRADKLFEVLVSGKPEPATVIRLLALTIPPVLPLTVPVGVLVGILIGLGRLAADGELVAMRAAGVPTRKVIGPVMLFALMGVLVTGFASLRLTPYSIVKSTEILNGLIANQLTASIEPRIFDENFPNTILYVGNVQPGDTAVWRHVFIADVTPPEQRTSGAGDKADGPLISVSNLALATSDPKNNRIQLVMRDYAAHEMGKDGTARDEFSKEKTMALKAAPPKPRQLASSAMSTRQLLQYRGPDWLDMQLEFHRRLALPFACIALAMVGIPLGIATRKGGKSAGYVNALLLAFLGYHLSTVWLVGLAKQGALPVPVAVWLPDIVFSVVGLIFMTRMEKAGDHDLLAGIRGAFGRVFAKMKTPTGRPAWRMPSLLQIVDTYVLSSFLFYLMVVLVAFVSMIEVYNFFELMGDMLKNSSLVTMFTYLFFLTPKLVYDTLPISVLVAVLVTLGVLSKQNEVTAFKACGVSLHRLAAPILIVCTLFTGALFGFNYAYVPAANRKQDALRAEIKGKPKQTYLNPDRTWIMGNDSRIYYYKYLDPAQRVMVGVSVFELDPQSFALKRQILAQRAYWSSPLNAWVFENGWSSDFKNNRRQTPRHDFQAITFPELNETPDYFLRETVKEQQMNFLELKSYIADLQQTGLVDTRKLQVQYHLKFANPIFALIMAMLAVPFGFLAGNRGAMTGIGASLGVAIAYRGLQPLFEKIGDAGLLPPPVAAWSPDAIFALVALYLLLRMRS